MRRRLVLLAALWIAVVISVACAGSNDSSPRGSGSAGPAASGHEAPAGKKEPVAAEVRIEGHNGRHRSRCGACHSAEDRQKPRWREIAGKLGHDVEGQLQERTTCNCCHLGEVKGFGEPFEARCLDCHDDMRVTIPKMGQQHCVGCHTLGSGDASEMVLRAWECQKCHAERQGTSAAIDVHGAEDCANCHRPHEEPWTEPRECTECHQAQEGLHHGKPGGDEAAPCTDCHRPHEQAGAASGRCVECHSQEKNPGLAVTALFQGHDACTNCHVPHQLDKAGAQACNTCHQNKHTMSGRGEGQHAACQNCHSPHDVKGSAQAACVKCHEKVESTHPDPKGTGCITCHDPHPSDTALGTARVLAAAECASCHSNARTQAASHAELQCGKCHQTHSEGVKVAGCKDCHATELARTALNPKHSECTQCHGGGAHRPQSNLGACAGCHAAEQSSAPKGHADCAQCHDSHSGKRPVNVGCTTCHAAKAAGAIALGHKECNDCHRPHGPDGPAAPPTCTTCHQPDKLVGLHVASGHQTCSSCHGSAHAPPKSDRETCVGCHANQKEHQPDAATCAGCHRFSGQ